MASLRDLGLSEYETRVYRTLLRTGATTAKELSTASDVPMGRIYDVLNGLEQSRVVRSQAASRPKKYVAVEPDTALDRLLEVRKRELAEKESQYEEIATELVSELDAADPAGEQFWTAAVGIEESEELLAERLSAADESIVLAAGSPSAQLHVEEASDRFHAEIQAALERGVSVSVLMASSLVDSIPMRILDRIVARLETASDFEARTCEDVASTFTLIDDAEVCIEVPNPLETDEPFAVFDLKDPDFAGAVEDVFEPRWAAAEPLTLERAEAAGD